MSIHVALNHRTHYTYEKPINLGPHLIRLRPAPHSRTPILSYSLKVEPKDHFINWQQDPYGNYQARIVFPNKTSNFLVEIDLVAEMAVYNPFDFFLEPTAEKYPFTYEESLLKELTPFLERLPLTPHFKDYLSKVDRSESRTIDFVVNLNRDLQSHIKYLIRLEPGVQTPEETLEKRSGSCRDSAWLLVQLFRNLGLAARFVSGYLIQLTADVKSLDGPSGTEKDFTDLHAWAEVYLPGAGWVGLDPTSGLLAGEGHIPLACTAVPSTAAPVSGSVDKCESKLDFAMSIQRIYESPRVTKPYTEEQWAKIEALGHLVDEKMKQGDVRLTMGGEPTFVSIDDMDGPEWNTVALGPKKRLLAGELIKRLKEKFAPGGFLHFGQGKWYPGESLPRWAFGCYWRKDGKPIWVNDALVGDEEKNYGYTSVEARRFIHALAERLNVDPKFSIPGYEDSWYYMWRERSFPTNIDPLKSNLEDPEERKRIAKIFDRGLDKVVGYTLPLSRWLGPRGPQWISGRWFIRREHLFLLPGDSPMGYRLPLDSLPHIPPEDYPYINELDPTVKRPDLPPPSQKSVSPASGLGSKVLPPRQIQAIQKTEPLSPSNLVRTALCVEPRDGRLYIFMPPTETLEDYLGLLSAVEDTADSLKSPVIVEGYTPPADYRINTIKVTPDPGVIEVNVHPAHSWDELVKNTNTLYEETRQIRLGTEKFMIDGRHAGTGGGNHIIIGGETPLNSPILRRPDLLRSLISYWHNHPSLSYLFSGLFIGPTCQAPRVDEARNDAVYELEIALNQIKRESPQQPWFVDRVLRNILVDVTGNTHRSEFCIDKLYSPDSASGRLGLVEMRAFEMPPHARMSLTQHLLLRSLIARFWEKPYTQSLVRWGTELHDRFMLPHFVHEDFDDVISEVRDFGFPLETEWFEPHFEFKFPLFGSVNHRGVHMEVRQALEPWNVMGEEGAAGSTVRYVDSSVERLQVKVQGLVNPRHVITCNGRRLPMHPTGRNGEFVAGVRYRAWQPSSCLHPHIPVHSPLTIDLLDSWMNKSMGGCVYHVMHPGGRNFTQVPINAFEAESRRLSRFFHFGHTPGKIPPPKDAVNDEFPFTLDLRKS